MNQTLLPLQPTLRGPRLELRPLIEADFADLYRVASDPFVWEQHPKSDRYKEDVFRGFFDGALESKGAFLVIDHESGRVAGSSRFYQLNPDNKQVFIGYTFLGRSFWGGAYNGEMKKLMLDHAFGYVNEVRFHIGAQNHRSRKACEKIGGQLTDERDKNFIGNVIYKILRARPKVD